ncbi:gamma-tubulin complex component 6-like [Uloborus diversus]|uniref:gamma-tubulin complex component 6-like n=1 Tax=Uloborus diversus TaxID=327109 RepID=UPI0024097AF2|nr:gamma-tubulin complex component 6-like [Uloborus diversus]
MNLEDSTLNVILHKLLDRFINLFERYAEDNRIDSQKIYCEIIKRSSEVGHELKRMAFSSQAGIKTADSQDLENELSVKLELLVDKFSCQDFFESACNFPEISFDYHLSDEDVHNFLYIVIMQQGKLLKPSSTELSNKFGFPLTASQFLTNITKHNSSFAKTFEFGVDCEHFSSSAQFPKEQLVFENDLVELQSLFSADLPGKSLNSVNAQSLPNTEDRVFGNGKPGGQHWKKWPPEERLSVSSSQTDFSDSASVDFELFCNAPADEEKKFLSWEQCLGGFLPNHLYTSELSPEEACHLAIKESQIYHSLFDPYNTISEVNMVQHALDLLIGIPSSTFQLNDVGLFELKQGIHLPNCSTGSTCGVMSDLVTSGNIFHMLQNWCGDIHPSIDGLILTGLKTGVKKCLSLYTEYIFSVKMNTPNMSLLKMDVFKNAQIINALGNICGINLKTYSFNGVSKGFNLFHHLRSKVVGHKHEDYAIILPVLLKYTYKPYLNFLNKWMTEGICDDPFSEFQVIEDPRYLNYRDSLFWRYAYIENVESPERKIPPEFKKFSHGILNCGKSIRLLKMCCSELPSLKFIFHHPLPSLSMIFSYHAAAHRDLECTSYLEHMEEMEKCVAMNSTVWEDQGYLDSQLCLSERAVRRNVLGKWKTLVSTATAFNSDLEHRDSDQDDHSCSSIKSPSLSRPIKRFKSLDTLIPQREEYGFSGLAMHGVGTLFSTCGRVESTFSPENTEISGDSNLNEIHLLKSVGIQSCFGSTKFNSAFLCTRSNEEVKCKMLIHSNDCAQANDNSGASIPCDTSKCDESVDDVDHYIVPSGSFVDKLLSLLLSQYGDSKEEVYSFLQFYSFHSLMVHNFSSVLDMRIHLIEKMVLKYIVQDLGLDCVLKRLRDIYFFLDEGFCQSLCLQLFDLVTTCRTPSQFANWAHLNELLSNAVSMSSNGNENFVDSISINIVSIPENMPLSRGEFLKLFYVQFEVSWPLNIIVHSACIKQYMNILSMLLEIEYLCWLLGKCWKLLMEKGKDLHLEDNSQYRKILFCRFDMDRFINVIQNSIREQLPGPLWEDLMKGLHSGKMSIDALEELHRQYLEKALARCFLTEETRVLHELVSVMFRQVYKFCSGVMDCQWRMNSTTGAHETPGYRYLCTAFSIYKQYQSVFLELWIESSCIATRNNKGSIDEEVWTTLGQRLSGIPGIDK